MFKLSDNFATYNDNKMPYSVFVERHTEIENLHAGIVNDEFALKSIGNRFILRTPMLSDFKFKTHFGFTSMAEFKTNLTLLFHYDKIKRIGKGIKVEYDLQNSFEISVIAFDRRNENVLQTIVIDGISLQEGDRLYFEVAYENGKVFGTLGESKFEFAVDEGNGYLALERGNYIGMCLLSDISVESNDEVKSEKLTDDMTIEIPVLNGGDIPYKLTFDISKKNEECYADVILSGGTSTRKQNREDRPGQYVAEVDRITAPYIKLKNGKHEEKFYIYNDVKLITDPNIFWECLNDIWNVPDMPMRRVYPISDKLFSKDLVITFGYECFEAKGYGPNSGAGEFIYDLSGNLIYGGEPLDGNVFEVLSPKDKNIISYIPKDAYKYDEIVKHLESNHYFEVCEDINLGVRIRTRLNPEYIKIKAQILDLYEREIIAEYTPDTKLEDMLFDFNTVFANISHAPLEEKLYRVKFMMYYGDSMVDRITKTFEVFDTTTDITPAVASGLPVVFSMPNEQKWLERSAFDLWNPMPSLDTEHYVSIITDTPIEAERRRVWEVLPPLKRKWFAWLQNRTCRDYQPEDHPETVKHSDYLYYAPEEVYPMRNDFYKLRAYTHSNELQNILREFLELHPDVKEKLNLNIPVNDGEVRLPSFFEDNGDADSWITNDHLKILMDMCHEEWFEFALTRLHEGIVKQNERLTALNPNFKRAIYGPFSQYVNCTLSHHTIRSFGLFDDERLSDEVYTGFAVFEDYPYSCAYQTYRGAFSVMTINLHIPNLAIYPEQYQGGKYGGCIDGAVKFSHAPMGKFYFDTHYLSTQSFEYIFNTPCRLDDGFSYWHDYGFHRPLYHADRWNKLIYDWRNVMDFKPLKPLKTHGFIAEYTDAEDVLDDETRSLSNTTCLNNRSEQSHGVIYECSREAGLNAGFALKWEGIKTLTPSECDFLVVPTLKGAPEWAADELRRLYNSGIGLVAVSDITGLEDIFGVTPKVQTEFVTTIFIEDDSENIYPMNTEFLYQADGADVLLNSNCDIPVVLKKGRAILLNAPTYDIGYESFAGAEAKGRKNVSRLLRAVLEKALVEIAEPIALGKDVGVTVFETEKGETVLLAMDYTPFDNREFGEREVSVTLDIDGITDAESERELVRVRDKNGKLKELCFKILDHESVFIKLK